jgi:hypothetical protein
MIIVDEAPTITALMQLIASVGTLLREYDLVVTGGERRGRG